MSDHHIGLDDASRRLIVEHQHNDTDYQMDNDTTIEHGDDDAHDNGWEDMPADLENSQSFLHALHDVLNSQCVI
jgi:hypothetical protein